MTIELQKIPYVNGTPGEGQSSIKWINNGDRLMGASEPGRSDGNLNDSISKVQENIVVVDSNSHIIAQEVSKNEADIQNLYTILNQGQGTDLIQRVSKNETDIIDLDQRVSQEELATIEIVNSMTSMNDKIGIKDANDTTARSLSEDTFFIRKRIGNKVGENINGEVDTSIINPTGIFKNIDDIIHKANGNSDTIAAIQQELTAADIPGLTQSVAKLRIELGQSPTTVIPDVYTRLDGIDTHNGIVDTEINEIKDQIGTGNIGQDITTLKTEVDELQLGLETANTNINTINNTIHDPATGLNKRITDVEASTEDLESVVFDPATGLEKKVNDIITEIGNGDVPDSIKGRINNLENDSQTNSSAIQNMQIDVIDLNAFKAAQGVLNNETTSLLVFPELMPGANDKEKLQNALNTGGNVIIKKPYTITSSLSINIDNTQVLFYGNGKITITANANIFNVYSDYCKILNSTLVGFGAPSTQYDIGTGITLHGVKDCEISFGKISNTGGDPILLLARTVNGVEKSCVNNVIAYNDIDCTLPNKRTFDTAGIMLGYSSYQAANYSHSYNHVYSNKIKGGTSIDHGIALIGHGNGNHFTQNTIEDCLEYGIVVYQSPYVDYTLYDNFVTGNNIKNIGHVSDNLCTKGMGIYLQKSDTTLVQGNIIDTVLLGTNNDTNLSRAGIALAGCVGSLVLGNTIENSMQFGVQIAESVACKVIDNYIDKCAKDLIRLTSSSKIDVHNNIGLNGGAYGIFIGNFTRTTGRADYNGTSGDNINITGNTLNCVNEGIWQESKDAQNKLLDSRLEGNLINSPAISIMLANVMNTTIISNKCKSNTTLARIQAVISDKIKVLFNTVESTNATNAGRIVIGDATNLATNYVIDGNIFSPSNSTTPIYINNYGFQASKKRFFNPSAPNVGTYDAGDFVWNTVPTAGSPLGWVCITAGAPGTWLPFAEVGGAMASVTTTLLQTAANTINTTGKYAGREVFNQTNSKKYYAIGNTPTSVWMAFDSSGSITPA